MNTRLVNGSAVHLEVHSAERDGFSLGNTLYLRGFKIELHLKAVREYELHDRCNLTTAFNYMNLYL